MAKYIDGFVLVIPKGKEADYQKMAQMGKDSWMKHGALQYFECRGDDLKQHEMGDQKSRAFRRWPALLARKMFGFHLLFLTLKNIEMK